MTARNRERIPFANFLIRARTLVVVTLANTSPELAIEPFAHLSANSCEQLFWAPHQIKKIIDSAAPL